MQVAIRLLRYSYVTVLAYGKSLLRQGEAGGGVRYQASLSNQLISSQNRSQSTNRQERVVHMVATTGKSVSSTQTVYLKPRLCVALEKYKKFTQKIRELVAWPEPTLLMLNFFQSI